MRCVLLILAVFASVAFGQDEERWFLSSDTSPVDSNKQAAILKAACEGDVHGDSCSKCPDSDEGSWTMSSLVLGHFSSARGEEALVGAGSCFYPPAGLGVGILVGLRDGKWTKLESVLAFNPDRCTQKKLRSGREFLLCESNEYTRDSQILYSLSTVLVENDEVKFHNLFTAADTTRFCWEGKAQEAKVQKVELGDLNGDGWEDISITATFGSFQMTERRQEQCKAAEEDRIQDRKPGKAFPRPAAIKTYKIELLFDGNRYTATPESRAAIALFHWDR